VLVTATFLSASTLYAISGAFYLSFAARGVERASRWATGALGLAVVAHVAFLASDYAVGGNLPTADIRQMLATTSLLVAIGYLTALQRYRLAVLGAFITPVTLLLLLGAGFHRDVATVPEPVRSALLPMHIGVNILGVVAFALAFAVALAYVIQERLLRRKQLGGLFQRMPPLDELDSLGLRLVTVGFPLLTVGIVTGAVVAARLGTGEIGLTPSRLTAMLAWVCFGAVLGLRALAGFRGRRAAIGTMLGFVCALVVLVGYVLRAEAS
jgi:ABC-type uncharacterized transport system permease subunit